MLLVVDSCEDSHVIVKIGVIITIIITVINNNQ